MKTKLLWTVLLFVFIFHASGVGHAQTTHLRSPENQADYIFITDSVFVDSLLPLVQYRAAQGFITKLVLLRDIYSEFKDDTLSDQEAIRHFTSYAMEYWSDPKPQYFLLVGDVDIVPSYRVRSRLAPIEYYSDTLSMDNRYAINLYQTDNLPDVALGRLPVSNNAQLSTVIHKIIRFETNLTRNNYPIDFLGISDSLSLFSNFMEDFIQSELPEYYQWTHINRASSPGHQGRKEIMSVLNQGSFFVTFYGHGSPFIWADSSFFTATDIDSLHPSNLPSIIILGSCSQRFDIPDSLTIVEKFLFLPQGGSVLSISANGIVYSGTDQEFLDHFYQELFAHPTHRVGEIMQTAFTQCFITNEPDDNFLRFTLLGDPALKLPDDVVTGLRQIVASPPQEFTLFQNFPNPFNEATRIRFTLARAGQVKITVHNTLGQQVAVLKSAHLSAGVHTFIWHPRQLPSGIYFIRMEFQQKTEVIRTLLLK